MDIHLNTNSVLQFCRDNKNTNIAIAKFDLEKAFDNVNHRFLFKMLKKLKLPNSLVKWIQILYKEPTCRIVVNGAFSNLIQITKGLRQGCPLSMLLFGIVLEALIQKVILNDQILGVKFGSETNLKLQACADDLTFYVSSKRSLDLVDYEMQLFQNVAGQKRNESKTEIIANGRQIAQQLQTSRFANKVMTKIDILGVVYSFQEPLLIENVMRLVNKVQTSINLHKERNLSLYGKIQLIKTKIFPLIFQKLLFLPL